MKRRIAAWMLRRLHPVTVARPPDFIIGGDENPYLKRWWIIPRNPFFNVYLHHFLRSDDDRALHDHPWWNLSFLLQGHYKEHVPGNRRRFRGPGDVVIRPARAAHRIELYRLGIARPEEPVWTLFITGPHIRQWGFHCPQGCRHWQVFTSSDGRRIGRGCD